MGINLGGRLFTIKVGRVSIAVSTPEIILNEAGLTILANTWIGRLHSPDYDYNYFSFHILGFGIGVQIMAKEESHA